MLTRFSLIVAGVIVIGSLAWAAEPAADELALLTTFRREFVDLTPGRGAFPGDFQMGRKDSEPAEGPVHRVAFNYEFAVARYEVPQNLWQAVMGANPSRWQGPRNAVEMLSHDEAVDFCRKITARLREAKLIKPSQVVRPPSEAEWEYAARAGTASVYSFGDDAKDLSDYAWSTHNAAGNDPPVGAKRPNAWNLFDMHGYLWEWCADNWHDGYSGAPADGTAWTAGGDARQRVLRGGSWKDPAAKLTSSYRRGAPRELKDDAVGLRCVLAGTTGERAAANIRLRDAIGRRMDATMEPLVRADLTIAHLDKALVTMQEMLADAEMRTRHPENSVTIKQLREKIRRTEAALEARRAKFPRPRIIPLHLPVNGSGVVVRPGSGA